ncbi:hypothetical protein EIN43_18710 [Enterobacter hormaechei]|uniref:Uncharacterized protein n=1 Tax=Enterobacter hormaechei TaxID=158836 RepID=A0A4Y5ZPS2_9ENTR|nr:hypothetical protein EIN43_18710 [Enterobacter hormaechei]
MANAAPDNAATTPAPTVPVVAQATDPAVTAAPGQTENIVPNQPTTGIRCPATTRWLGRSCTACREPVRRWLPKIRRRVTLS